MAAAKAVVTVPDIERVWFDGRMLHVIGTVAIDASPATYTAGGIVMALNNPLIKATRTPQKVEVKGIAGYIYRYIKGTDNTNGLLKIFEQSGVDDTPLDEYDDATTIAAAISGDTIDFEAMFLGQN